MPKINIQIEMPSTPTASSHTTLCEYVQELIDDIEAGYPSPQAWKHLRCIFNRLAVRRTLSAVQKRAFELMEPIILKYGLNDSDGVNLAAAYPHEGHDTMPHKKDKPHG